MYIAVRRKVPQFAAREPRRTTVFPLALHSRAPVSLGHLPLQSLPLSEALSLSLSRRHLGLALLSGERALASYTAVGKCILLWRSLLLPLIRARNDSLAGECPVTRLDCPIHSGAVACSACSRRRIADFTKSELYSAEYSTLLLFAVTSLAPVSSSPQPVICQSVTVNSGAHKLLK